MDLKKIECIVAQFQKKLDIAPLADEIDERVEQEKETNDAPVPSVQASQNKEQEVKIAPQEEVVEDDKEAKIASLKRYIKLAKAVKNSKKLSAQEKKQALKNIAKASKKADKESNGVIDRKMMNTQNTGPLRKKIMYIYTNIDKISKLKPNATLSSYGVDLPMTVDKLTLRWLVNVLYDIVSK